MFLSLSEVAAGGLVSLVPLHSPAEFYSQLEAGIQIILFPHDHEQPDSWVTYALHLHRANPEAKFVLISDSVSTGKAISMGADLVLRMDDADISACLHALVAKVRNEYATSAGKFPDRMVSELQIKNRELEKINYELDRFVYSASHDLRSPLTSVLGLLYLLREELVDESALHYVKLMEESILKLDNTIRDIVAYSRNNRTDINIEEIDLKSLIHDIGGNLRYLETDQLHISEVIQIKKARSFVCDRNRLQVVLNNLLANSIRYRHPSRKLKINISTEVEDGYIHIKVSDNGIGIKEHHIDRIFDMFYRSNESSTGSGLGLYIVRETVKKMGGTIKVVSDVNVGTEFLICLPVQVPAVLSHGAESN